MTRSSNTIARHCTYCAEPLNVPAAPTSIARFLLVSKSQDVHGVCEAIETIEAEEATEIETIEVPEEILVIDHQEEISVIDQKDALTVAKRDT